MRKLINFLKSVMIGEKMDIGSPKTPEKPKKAGKLAGWLDKVGDKAEKIGDKVGKEVNKVEDEMEKMEKEKGKFTEKELEKYEKKIIRKIKE